VKCSTSSSTPRRGIAFLAIAILVLVGSVASYWLLKRATQRPAASKSTSLGEDRASGLPEARDLLRTARLNEGARGWKLRGNLRVGSKKQPFRLISDKNAIHYEFLDSGDTITLRPGEKSSTLEERGGKTSEVTAVEFGDSVRGTDIRYEDLALRFLYWSDAKVVGGDTMFATSCWKVEVRPPSKGESQYSRVVLWIGKELGALMKAEGFDQNDQCARRFVVRTVMKRQGVWLLKDMRIESADGRRSDPQPTYIEIDDVEKEPAAGG
jgi:hypothetical protein